MIDVVTFWVPGEPRSKARPRFARNDDGTVRTYTDQATLDGETAVANAAVFANPKLEPIESPIKLEATFYLWRRNRRDLDNMAKLILDALNGIAYHDDEQVVSLTAVKKRAETKDDAGTTIRVTAFPGDDHSQWPIVPASQKAQQSAPPVFPGATIADQRTAANISPSMRRRILKALDDYEGLNETDLAQFLNLPVGAIRAIRGERS